MNLYLVYRTDDVGYDQYDSIVVAADSSEVALSYNPGGDKWPFECLVCELIGKAANDVKPGIVLSSFRAG